MEWTIELGDKHLTGPLTLREWLRTPHRSCWATAVRDGWVIGLQFVVKDGQPLLAELRVFPDEGQSYERSHGTWSIEASSVPGTGLPAALVHNLGLWTLEKQVRAALADYQDPAWPGDRDWDDPNEPPDHWLEWDNVTTRLAIDPTRTGPARRPGRPPLSDEKLALVAFFYVEALRKQVAVHRHIQDQMKEGSERLPVQNWIAKARQRGFLTSSPKNRKAGGTLTPKTVALLQDIEVLPPSRDSKPPTDTEGETT